VLLTVLYCLPLIVTVRIRVGTPHSSLTAGQRRGNLALPDYANHYWSTKETPKSGPYRRKATLSIIAALFSETGLDVTNQLVDTSVIVSWLRVKIV
jgi:hypothetical protein